MTRRLLAVLGAAVLASLCFTGCGPVWSTSVIVQAQAELDGAKAAEADKHAVYEYTAATEYLHKAREEQGYADFGPAIELAQKAQDFAQRSIARANAAKAVPRPVQAIEPVTSSPPLAPPSAPAPVAPPRIIIKKIEPPPAPETTPLPVPEPTPPEGESEP